MTHDVHCKRGEQINAYSVFRHYNNFNIHAAQVNSHSVFLSSSMQMMSLYNLTGMSTKALNILRKTCLHSSTHAAVPACYHHLSFHTRTVVTRKLSRPIRTEMRWPRLHMTPTQCKTSGMLVICASVCNDACGAGYVLLLH